MNFISLTIGTVRHSPFVWRSWASVYLGTNLTLFFLDLMNWAGPHGPYVQTWIVQQFAIVTLGWFLVRTEMAPTGTLVVISSIAATLVGAITFAARIYPSSLLEPVMVICGLAGLSLGIMSAFSTLTIPKLSTAIPALFFLLYALLMLAGAEFLTSPGLGRAWSVMEIAAFSAWGVLWIRAKPA